MKKRTHPRWTTDEIQIDLGAVSLGASLSTSPGAVALVVLPHLGLHGHRTHRTRRLIQALHERRIATLSVDLGPEPALQTLARRLVDVTDWARRRPRLWDLPISYVAANASAVALIAAARRPGTVGAVVSCGGHPDLAGDALARVEAPTLLLAADDDPVALDENRHAIAAMTGPSWIEHVPHGPLLADDAHAADVGRRAALWCLHSGAVAATRTAA